MSGFLVINPRSGDADPSAEELRDEARRRGIETHLLAPDDDPSEVARGAPDGALGMAGGDGSLAAVAAGCNRARRAVRGRAVRNPEPLRPRSSGSTATTRLPLSQRSKGSEQRVDVGRVNERLFLNNVSLGLYARLVHRREGHRRRREAFARLRALGLFAPAPRFARRDGRRPARPRENRARRQQRLQARAALGRRARPHRRGQAPSLRRPRLASRGAGRSNAARRSRSTRERGACRRRSTESPRSSRRRSSSRSSRPRYGCCSRQAESKSRKCGNASSSTGISSGANQRSSATSSAGSGSPSTMRAVQ